MVAFSWTVAPTASMAGFGDRLIRASAPGTVAERGITVRETEVVRFCNPLLPVMVIVRVTPAAVDAAVRLIVAEEAPAATVAGDAVTPVGRLPATSWIGRRSPPTREISTVMVLLDPAARVTLLGSALTSKSEASSAVSLASERPPSSPEASGSGSTPHADARMATRGEANQNCTIRHISSERKNVQTTLDRTMVSL
jgi:hypothetical protein